MELKNFQTSHLRVITNKYCLVMCLSGRRLVNSIFDRFDGCHGEKKLIYGHIKVHLEFSNEIIINLQDGTGPLGLIEV